MNRWLLPTVLLTLSCLSAFFIRTLTPNLFEKHVVALVLGMGVFVLVSRIPAKLLFSFPWQIYILTCLIVLMPLLLTNRIRGTARWITFGDSFQVQPSQLAFTSLGLALTSLFYRYTKKREVSLATSVTLVAIAGLPVGLIALEPDLGTALFLSFCLGVLLFVSGLPFRHLLLFSVGSIMLVYIGWLFLLQPYQRQRITSFINPSTANSDETYNVRQSLIAIGAGGLTGSGIGQGTQSQLRYLPEKSNDFIFAAFSEEFGFIGAILLIALYVLLVLFLFKEAYQMASPLHRIFLIYVATQLFFQAMINISTNIGLVPVTGITLPFFSYGGTSILAIGAALGIAQSCLIEKKRQTSLHIV